MSSRPNAVIAHWDGLHFFDRRSMASLGEVVTIIDSEPIGSWDDPRAADLLAQAEVLIGHWGCPLIDDAVLDRAPNLGLFAYAAGTVKQTVTEAVFARGIRVTSGAKANAEPVAEFTLAAILFANKEVFWRRLQTPAGEPLLPTPATAGHRVGNWAKTIGIVGASLVGRRVIELLAPFPELRVLLYDPFVSKTEAAALGVEKAELDDLCARVDILSIHAPDLPSTRHLVGADQLAALRTGATVINTARPAIVDQDALTAELRAGRLWAVLDVTDPEPLPGDHVLRTLPNAFVTPHLAGSEGRELGRMTAHVTEEVRRWAADEPPLNGVTLEQLSRLA
jgi:phosphoglycerate dehydrogenase-like enzyme